jgi:hypothetical protein
MTSLKLEPTKSQIRIRTYAKGLFSPLAHDLELEAKTIEGSGDGGAKRGELRVSTKDIRVVGVLKKGRVDTSILSDKDRGEIEKKIRESVLDGGPWVVVQAEMDGSRAKLSIQSSQGPQIAETAVLVLKEADNVTTVEGSLKLSMKKLGVAEVKGPLGAFKVGDEVEVEFKVAFVPA